MGGGGKGGKGERFFSLFSLSLPKRLVSWNALANFTPRIVHNVQASFVAV